MERFSIEVVSKPEMQDDVLCCYGHLVMNDEYEQFIMTLDSWTIEDYKQQWREAIERLKSHDVSCFVAKAQDMSGDPFVWVWPLYKIGDTVFIQNHLISSHTPLEHAAPLVYTDINAQNCYDFIRPRETINEDGRKISEWSVPLADVLNFKVV